MKLTPAHFADRNRRKIRKMDKETKQLYRIEKAKREGNCCWKIWNRYTGGESIILSRSETYEPGWRIASVEMLKNCNLY